MTSRPVSKSLHLHLIRGEYNLTVHIPMGSQLSCLSYNGQLISAYSILGLLLTFPNSPPQASSKGFKTTSLVKVTAKISLLYQGSLFIRHFVMMTIQLSETRMGKCI